MCIKGNLGKDKEEERDPEGRGEKNKGSLTDVFPEGNVARFGMIARSFFFFLSSSPHSSSLRIG